MNGEMILFLSVGAVATDMIAADIMVSNVLYMGVALICPNLTVLVDSAIAVA